MIVPSYTDDRILQELMDDWPGVKRKAKKVGDELLKKMPKGRIGMNPDKFFTLRKKYVSKNGNHWHVAVSCQEGKREWWTVAFAEVENGYGTRSMFYLRAVHSPHPYYVELIPHAIRRIRERYINTRQENLFADVEVEQLCEQAVFTPHDCGVFLGAGKVRRDGHFQLFTDGDGNTPGVVLLKNSMFYARRTPSGNFIFKTFITPESEPGSRKEEFIKMMFGLWRAANPKDRHNIDEERIKIINALWKMFPTMHRHLDCIHERMIPLFP